MNLSWPVRYRYSSSAWRAKICSAILLFLKKLINLKQGIGNSAQNYCNSNSDQKSIE